MERIWRDVKFGLRTLGNNPGYAAIAVLTLALGIGANTAVFSVLNSVLLQSLPVAHPEELVILTDPDSHGHSFGSQSGDRAMLAYSEFEYLRDHNQVFSKIFAADSDMPEVEITTTDSASGGGKARETAKVRLVSGDYFATLGTQPAAGRFFTKEVDGARGGAPIAVVSYAFWRQRLGLSPAALGKTIQIRRTSFEIVGVTPPEFTGETVGEAVDVWVPMMMQEAIVPGVDLLSPSPTGLTNVYEWLQVIGRRKPGVPFEQAKAGISVDFKQMLESIAGPGLTAEERKNGLDQQLNPQSGARGASTLHGHFADPLRFLMVLVGLILLMACVNVANLVLARGAARQKEFAMRLAIGAGRGQLIRQLLTESLLLALMGAAAGVLVANWMDTLLLRMVSGTWSGPIAIQLNLQPDGRVLGFTLGLTVLTAMLFGLIPAMHVTRLNLSPVLKTTTLGVTGEAGPGGLPLGKVLVAAQVAISMILLVAAGLFVRSLEKLSAVNLGYARENLLLFKLNAAAGAYHGGAQARLYQQLLDRISAIPGVRGATVSHNGLFSGSESGDPVAVEGHTPKPDEDMNSRMDHVAPGYFSTMGIPLRMGREIELGDSVGAVRAAVINETFARQFFPNTNPIGKHVRDTYLGNPADTVVVGVVSDAKYNSLKEKAQPRLYAPLFNPMWEQATAVFEIRTYADPAPVMQALRDAVRETSGTLPEIEIRTMAGLISNSMQSERFVVELSEAFGILAIVLASVGLYGIMAYTVARRTRDIGIRLALGAEPGNVLREVLRETLLLVAVGIVIGVPIAVGGTFLVRSMLFGLGFADPVAILLAAAVLAIVAAFAGYLPARRASHVDPIVALRYE